MDTVNLRPDCARCAALCCIGLAFDRSALFAFDKLAGEPCRNLEPSGRCRIHGELERRGFGGCVAFDCHGAGQYVTQAMFGGRSWRDDPSLLEPMMAAFRAIQEVHELLSMLREARGLALPHAVGLKLAALEQALMPAAGWTRQDVAVGRVRAATEEVRAFLRTLQPFAEAAVRRPVQPADPAA
jgi:hypothetical protein